MRNTNTKGILQFFKQHAADLPQLHHVWILAEHLQKLEEQGLSAKTLKQQLKVARTLYPELSLLEQMHALKGLSSAAHVATPERDPELFKIFQEAYEMHIAYSGSKRPIPRLVVLESDFPGYAASNSCSNQQTVFINTASQSILTRDEIKAGLLHEFGHLNRDLNRPMYCTVPQHVVTQILTRNASRRAMEHAADSYAVKCGMPVEVVQSGLIKATNHITPLFQRLHDNAQQFITKLNASEYKMLRIVAWGLDKKLQPLRDRMTTAERETTRGELYPSIRDRVNKLGEANRQL